MTKYRALTLAAAVLFSVFVLAPPVTAGAPAGVTMKEGKVMMMEDGADE